MKNNQSNNKQSRRKALKKLLGSTVAMGLPIAWSAPAILKAQGTGVMGASTTTYTSNTTSLIPGSTQICSFEATVGPNTTTPAPITTPAATTTGGMRASGSG